MRHALCVQDLSMAAGIASISSVGAMADESAALRAALCAAADLPDSADNADSAMARLAAQAPQQLQAILAQHLRSAKGSLALRLVHQQLQALGVTVERLQADVGAVKQDVAAIRVDMKAEIAALVESEMAKVLRANQAVAAAPPARLPRYLVQFWDKFVGNRRTAVPGKTFIDKVAVWYTDDG